jgi:hypothetical protein
VGGYFPHRRCIANTMPKNLPWSLVGGVDIRTSGLLRPLRRGLYHPSGGLYYLVYPPSGLYINR